MSKQPGWEGILDTDERILWQGRPNAGLALRSNDILVAVFGLCFSGFAVFWMKMAASAGGSFWAFGLIHFTAGLAVACGALFQPSIRRKFTWYTLTDQRAFVATALPWRRRTLDSYPITANTALRFRDGRLPSIEFATQTIPGRKRSHKKPIGFERIEDGADVYRLMRNIQKGIQ